jgi:hypothetical protein
MQGHGELNVNFIFSWMFFNIVITFKFATLFLV